jgi:hypothetical protein
MIIIAFVFQVANTMTQKIWIDDRLNDITKLIAVQGKTQTEEIKSIENDIIDNMGGSISYETTYKDAVEHKVQLGTVVKVKYNNSAFPIITINDFNVSITVDIVRQAISEVYYK